MNKTLYKQLPSPYMKKKREIFFHKCEVLFKDHPLVQHNITTKLLQRGQEPH